MANFEDAAVGWTIYRDRGGRLSRAALNQSLRLRGREPISDRTFNHYRKLLRLGYSDYVSINRLDLRHSNESIFDVADRSRYLDRPLSTPGRLVIPRSSGFDIVEGTIEKVSEGFATLRTERTAEADRVIKAVKYNRGVLVFTQVAIERAVRVVEGLDGSNGVELLLEFRSLLETDLILEQSPIALTVSRLRLDLGADASLYRVLGAVHTTFDLFESIRGFVDAATTVDNGQAVTLPALRVRHLEFSNPYEALLYGAGVVTVAAAFVLTRVSSALGSSVDVGSKLQAVKHEGNAERRRKQMHQLEVKSRQLDNIKKAIEIDHLIQQMRPSLSQIEGVMIPDIDAALGYRLEMLKDQAVEAATELELRSNEPVTLDVEESDDP